MEYTQWLSWLRYHHRKEFWPILVRSWHFETLFQLEVMFFIKFTNNNGSSMHKKQCYWFIFENEHYLWSKRRFKMVHLLIRMGHNFFHDSTDKSLAYITVNRYFRGARARICLLNWLSDFGVTIVILVAWKVTPFHQQYFAFPWVYHN